MGQQPLSIFFGCLTAWITYCSSSTSHFPYLSTFYHLSKSIFHFMRLLIFASVVGVSQGCPHFGSSKSLLFEKRVMTFVGRESSNIHKHTHTYTHTLLQLLVLTVWSLQMVNLSEDTSSRGSSPLACGLWPTPLSTLPPLPPHTEAHSHGH